MSAPDTPLRDIDRLIYDWNRRPPHRRLTEKTIELHDETLRDGIQGPSIIDPTIEQKLRLLELADALGVHSSDLGLPGAGARAVEDVTALCRHIQQQRLKIQPTCAARTHINDLRAVAQISQNVGLSIEVMAFLGTSPIRQLAEGWDEQKLLDLTVKAAAFCRQEGLPFNFVTEDTTRSHPKLLRRLFTAAIEAGACRLTLCDTVGHATPDGVRALITWTRNLIDELDAPVKIDWHGHNDRGFGVVNSLFALQYGADRAHGTALGIGERVGNASLDQMLVNLKLLEEIDQDLSQLGEWVQLASEATGTAIPASYPVFGADAFRTATGVHASAIIKAREKGDDWLADRIYSGVSAGDFGKKQLIEVGHQSGLSNVKCWLEDHGIAPRPGLAEHLLAHAKTGSETLSDAQLLALIEAFGG